MGIYSNGTIYGIKIYTFAENASENWSSQNVGSPHIFSSNANENDDYSITLYEKVYDVIMTDEQKLEAYVFYTKVTQGFAESRGRSKSAIFGRDENNLSNQFRFQVYTECISTLEPNDKTTFKNWWPISLEQFLDYFNH